MRRKPGYKEKSVLAAVVVSAVIVALFLFCCYLAMRIIFDRAVLPVEGVRAVRRVFYISGAMMLLAVGEYLLWINITAKKAAEDIDRLTVLEEKLQKAQAAEKAKTTFLSNMSHDIRTPMNAIIGFATLVRANLDNRERVDEYVGKILSSSNYLLSLINDVLDMSRIESGKLNIEEKPCSISEIFRDMRNIIQTQTQSKQLNFFMDTLDVVDEEVFCDRVHINQMLLNLLSNAIKFTAPGGSISMTVSQLPGAPEGFGAYEFRVKDTGIGMSQAFVEHIFEPFERERRTTVNGIQGTGLGMAITKNIVDSMGGTIRVDTQERVGTEFIINLTFRLQSEVADAGPSPVLEGKSALVVDDSFAACDSMTRMLAQLGLQASWTMHGLEAPLRARQAMELEDDFSVYVVDWVLPDLNGMEVVKQLRAIVGDEPVIIVMTAYDWSAFEEEAKEAGVTAFCSKPVFLAELREILENAVNKTERPAVPALPAVDTSLTGKRLLVVEDNEMNREIAVELLTASGFEVDTAEDGTVAVRKVETAEAGRYDLILMDVQMPILNGHETTRFIRSMLDPAKASIPIVAMTANAFKDDQRLALECGMNGYVPKPINVDELIAVLHEVLG